MTSIFSKIQCSIHQSSDNSSMNHVKRYLISAALIICLLYNVIFTPSNTIVQRTINIVTEKVKSVENCKEYILSFILNGKYVQPTAKTSQPELTWPSCFSDCHLLREGSLWGPVCISRDRLWRLGGGGGQQGAGGHDSPHTMPGGTSTSRLSPKLRTITRHVYSHSGVPNCWSRKLSKANFCTIANIWGEIC